MFALAVLGMKTEHPQLEMCTLDMRLTRHESTWTDGNIAVLFEAWSTRFDHVKYVEFLHWGTALRTIKTISPAPDEHDTAYPLPWNATILATGLPFNVQVFCFPRSMWLDISFAMPTTEPPNVGMKKTSEMAIRSQCISRTIQQVIEIVPAHVIFLVLTAGGNKLMHRACVHVGAMIMNTFSLGQHSG